jgi:hypothetical protein
MEPFLIIELEILPQTLSGFTGALIAFQIHLLVFYATPQAFNHDVVKSSASVVKVDSDIRSFQRSQKTNTGKLTALVGIDISGLVPLRTSSRASQQNETSKLCWTATRIAHSG